MSMAYYNINPIPRFALTNSKLPGFVFSIERLSMRQRGLLGSTSPSTTFPGLLRPPGGISADAVGIVLWNYTRTNTHGGS